MDAVRLLALATDVLTEETINRITTVSEQARKQVVELVEEMPGNVRTIDELCALKPRAFLDSLPTTKYLRLIALIKAELIEEAQATKT